MKTVIAAAWMAFGALSIAGAACSAASQSAAGSGEPDASDARDANATPDTDATPDADAAAQTRDADAAPDASPDAAAYNPCPALPVPCRIMPLGDSITYGYQSTTLGGYRSVMFAQALDAHLSITFVGSLTSGPATVDGVTFPQENEGHSGFTIDDDADAGRSGLQPIVASAIATYQPNIVALMIGTNDVDIQLDLANAPARLGKLLDTILAADPTLLLVVAQITPTQSDAENTLVQAYNAAIPGLVASRAQAGKHILLADMYDPFVADPAYQTDYLANALHPTDAGFVVMGQVWWSAIGAFFR